MTRSKFTNGPTSDEPTDREGAETRPRSAASAVDRFAAVNRRMRSKITDRPETIDSARPRPAPPPEPAPAPAPPPVRTALPPRPAPRIDVHNPPVAPSIDEPVTPPPSRQQTVRPPEPPAPQAPRWNPQPSRTIDSPPSLSSPGDVFRDMAPVANPLRPNPLGGEARRSAPPTPPPPPEREREPEPTPEPAPKRSLKPRRTKEERGPSDAFRLFTPKPKPAKPSKLAHSKPLSRSIDAEPVEPTPEVKTEPPRAPEPIAAEPIAAEPPPPMPMPIDEPVARPVGYMDEPRMRSPVATSAFSDSTNTLDRLITRVSVAAILLVGLFLAVSIIPRL